MAEKILLKVEEDEVLFLDQALELYLESLTGTRQALTEVGKEMKDPITREQINTQVTMANKAIEVTQKLRNRFLTQVK